MAVPGCGFFHTTLSTEKLSQVGCSYQERYVRFAFCKSSATLAAAAQKLAELSDAMGCVTGGKNAWCSMDLKSPGGNVTFVDLVWMTIWLILYFNLSKPYESVGMGKYSFKWWRLTICHPIRQLKKIYLIIVTFFTVLERCVQKQSDHCVQGAGVGGPYHMFTMEGLHRMWCSCQAWKCFHQTKPLAQLPSLHFLHWLAPYNYSSGYPGNHSSYQGTATMAPTIVFGFGLGIRTVPHFRPLHPYLTMFFGIEEPLWEMITKPKR